MTWRVIYRWPIRQVRGFGENVVGVGRQLFSKPQAVVPPSIWSTWVWLKSQIPRAFGFGTPFQQIAASVVLGVITFLSGLLTGGLAWAFIGVWLVTGMIGLLRLWPFINEQWNRFHPAGG